MAERSSEPRTAGRPFGVQLLAALLTMYAMGGIYIAAALVTGRPPELRWELVAAGGIIFGLVAGFAARSAWRLAPDAPRWLVGCGACGAGLCILLASGAQRSGDETQPDTWRMAITGAILFLAFLALAARYVRRHIRSRS